MFIMRHLLQLSFFLLFSISILAQSSIHSPATVGIDFFYNGYLKEKVQPSHPGMFIPGVALNYTKGLRGKYAWSVMMAGSFCDSIIRDKGFGNKKLLLEGDAFFMRKFTAANSRIQPFAGIGAGLGIYNAQYQLFIPAGLGMQVGVSKFIYATFNAQYRLSVASAFRSHLLFSIGIGGAIPSRSNPKPSRPVANRSIARPPISDRDRDGIPDDLDRCPEEPGFASNHGCPEPKPELIIAQSTDTSIPELPALSSPVALSPDSSAQYLIRQLNLLALDILFETNSHILQSSSFAVLDTVSALLIRNNGINITIEGHTDNVGSESRNLLLSEQRAQAVLNYLVVKGVSNTRLKAEGFGETRPIADNRSEKGRALNRRVSFKIQ